MAAPRWVFIAFLVLLSLLGLCSSYRPLPAARDEDSNGISISMNGDGQLEPAVIGSELCGDNGCFEPKQPDFGGCGSCEPPVVVEPCLPPLPPVILPPLPPPIEVEPRFPPLPPVILPPLPPPIEVEPRLPPLPPVILPLPPVVVLPPTGCPVPAPCSDGGVCRDLQGQEYDDNAMEPTVESQTP